MVMLLHSLGARSRQRAQGSQAEEDGTDRGHGQEAKHLKDGRTKPIAHNQQQRERNAAKEANVENQILGIRNKTAGVRTGSNELEKLRSTKWGCALQNSYQDKQNGYRGQNKAAEKSAHGGARPLRSRSEHMLHLQLISFHRENIKTLTSGLGVNRAAAFGVRNDKSEESLPGAAKTPTARTATNATKTSAKVETPAESMRRESYDNRHTS